MAFNAVIHYPNSEEDRSKLMEDMAIYRIMIMSEYLSKLETSSGNKIKKVCKVVAKQIPFLSVKSNLLTDSRIVADSSQGVNKVEHWFSVLVKYHERCVIEVSVANEILMHFRSQKKTGQDVSLSDYIETGTDGAALALMEVVSDDEDLLETVSRRESVVRLVAAVDGVLTPQEREVVCLRYGLGGIPAKRQREVADITGISRSYVSRIEKRALQKLRAALEGA